MSDEKQAVPELESTYPQYNGGDGYHFDRYSDDMKRYFEILEIRLEYIEKQLAIKEAINDAT